MNVVCESRSEKVNVQVLDDSRSLALAVARRVAALIRDEQALRRPCNAYSPTSVEEGHGDPAGNEVCLPVEVAISGGFTTSALLPALLECAEGIDWSGVRFWWVDERFVPSGHSDRNDEEAVASVLSRLPGVRWVPMPCDERQGLEQARQDFLAEWNQVMGARCLDIALLGMGPDGHIASLFPGDEWVALGSDSPAVISVDDSPKPPAQRLSLSMPVICASKHIILATGGAAKAQAVAGILSGESASTYPAAALLASTLAESTSIYLDAAAASELGH